MNNQKIAVAICTYNRAKSLRKTLSSLTSLESLTSIEWCLLIIDNNSSDNTPEVVKEFEDKLPLKYFHEPEQGLSNARNRALIESEEPFLIFTDDDILFESKWLLSYQNAFAAFPEAGYFGGKIEPYWTGNKPSWLTDPGMPLIGGLLGLYDLGHGDREITSTDPLPFGANFAIRRSVMDEFGVFDPLLGASGKTPGRGEEVDYLQRAQSQKVPGKYVAGAVCFHHIPDDRFDLHFLYHYGIEKGRAAVLMGSKKFPSRFGRARFLLRGVAQLLKGRRDRFYQCVINMGIQQGVRFETTRHAR